MDAKLFKRTFPFICDECAEFTHTMHDHCGKCGANSLRKAIKQDYKNRNNSN